MDTIERFYEINTFKRGILFSTVLMIAVIIVSNYTRGFGTYESGIFFAGSMFTGGALYTLYSLKAELKYIKNQNRIEKKCNLKWEN